MSVKLVVILASILVLFGGLEYGLLKLQARIHHKQPVLVYKTKGNIQVVRAVIGGRLAVLIFEYKDGVWFLGESKWASDLKG